jgi:glycosyltransferase 2 family protein
MRWVRQRDVTEPTITPRRVQLALLAGGAALLVLLVRDNDPAALSANLGLAGWGIVLVIGQEVGAVLANTLGWWTAFPRPRPPVAFRHLVAARLAGDAFNYVTPTASIGGEFVRGHVLVGRASGMELATSIAVAKVCQTIAQVAFIVMGVTWAFTASALPHAWYPEIGILTAALIVAAGGLLVAQRRGLFGGLARILGALDRHGRLGHLGARLRRLDVEIARAHRSHASIATSCAWFFVGWTLGVLEIYLILWLLALPATFTLALTIETLSQVIDAVLFFVPAKLGTQEGGKMLIFTALGIDATKGLSLGLLRRIRELVWAAVGLLILWHSQLGLSDARSAAATEAPLSAD